MHISSVNDVKFYAEKSKLLKNVGMMSMKALSKMSPRLNTTNVPISMQYQNLIIIIGSQDITAKGNFLWLNN